MDRRGNVEEAVELQRLASGSSINANQHALQMRGSHSVRSYIPSERQGTPR